MAIELENHISYQQIKDVRDICQRFFSETPFRYFDYGKLYDSGEIVALYSDGEFGKFYSSDDGYKYPGTLLNSGVHLWQNYFPHQIVGTSKQEFGYDYPISLFYRYDGYTEIFDFAVKPGYHAALDLYLNRLDILEQFILYFKDKASTLINIQENQNLLKLPSIVIGEPLELEYSQHRKLDLLIKNQDANAEFLGAAPFAKHSVLSRFRLSRQQSICLYYFVRGCSAARIAQHMNLSKRTVESYLNEIKNKTCCINKEELLTTVIACGFCGIRLEDL